MFIDKTSGVTTIYVLLDNETLTALQSPASQRTYDHFVVVAFTAFSKAALQLLWFLVFKSMRLHSRELWLSKI